jgi:hypothetical protein
MIYSSVAVDLFHVVNGAEADMSIIVCHHGFSLVSVSDLAVIGLAFHWGALPKHAAALLGLPIGCGDEGASFGGMNHG